MTLVALVLGLIAICLAPAAPRERPHLIGMYGFWYVH